QARDCDIRGEPPGRDTMFKFQNLATKYSPQQPTSTQPIHPLLDHTVAEVTLRHSDQLRAGPGIAQCDETSQPNDPIKAPAYNHSSFRDIARRWGAKRGGKMGVAIDQGSFQSCTH